MHVELLSWKATINVMHFKCLVSDDTYIWLCGTVVRVSALYTWGRGFKPRSGHILGYHYIDMAWLPFAMVSALEQMLSDKGAI